MMNLRPASLDSILAWALQTGLAVTVLILLVLVMRRPFAHLFGARAAYALWALPLLRVFLPNVTISETLLPWSKPAPLETITQAPLFTDFSANALALPVTQATPNWTLTALLIWLCGAALFLMLQAIRQSYARHDVLQRCTPVSDMVRQAAASAASDLGLSQSPNVFISKENAGPMIMGVFSPIIILPRDFETHFSASQRRLALLHELAHLRRRDLWAASLALVFRALNWPNPLVHYAAKSFRADQEAACDATVLSLFEGSQSARQSYGETLLQAAKLATSSPRFRPTDVPIGLTISHPLKERLMTLKTPQTRPGRLMRGAAFSAVMLGALATIPYSIASAHPDETLAGGTVSSSTKSSHSEKRHKIVSVVSGDNNGNPWEKKFEIEVENGNITAFETDEVTGRKRQMALNEIKNFDADIMNGSQWSLRVDERGQLILIDADAARVFQAKGGHGLLMPPPPPVPSFSTHPHDSAEFAGVPIPPTPPSASQSFVVRGSEVLSEFQLADARLEAARALLEDTKDSSMSPEVLQKLEDARQTLAEAQAALKANK